MSETIARDGEASQPEDGTGRYGEYEFDVLEEIRAGLEDFAAGRVIPHEEVVARLRARFGE